MIIRGYSISLTEDRFYSTVHIRRVASRALNNLCFIRFKAREVIAQLYTTRMEPSGTCTDQYSTTSRFSPPLVPLLPPPAPLSAHLPQLNIGIDFHGSGKLALGPRTLASKVALHVFQIFLHYIYV